MILKDVMEQLAAQLATIEGLRAYDWPIGSAAPPAAIVSFPTSFGEGTYQRGMDTMTIPVVVLVGRPTDRSTRDLLSKYLDGAGGSSIKATLESGRYTAFHTIVVRPTDTDVYELGGTAYLAALFDCEIAGSGK